MKTEPPGPVHLRATKLCNHDHPAIRNKAKALVQGKDAPKDVALRIFYFVRDSIPFDATLDIWNRLRRLWASG